jgi:protein gp37
MSDLFHEAIPGAFIRQVFDTMVQAHWHVFQILTKRAERLADLTPRLPGPPNVWQGVSVENTRHIWWIAYLQQAPLPKRSPSITMDRTHRTGR